MSLGHSNVVRFLSYLFNIVRKEKCYYNIVWVIFIFLLGFIYFDFFFLFKLIIMFYFFFFIVFFYKINLIIFILILFYVGGNILFLFFYLSIL